MDEPRVIKRYANRKLYDTVLRRFTTLDELAALVESGLSVEVRDHDSGADRTADVLAQVLGRRLKSGAADPDAVAGLLSAPVQAATGLSSLLLGATTSKPAKPAGKSSAKPGKSSAKTGPKAAKKGEKKAGKREAAPVAADDDAAARDAELRELRQQVSELTAVVNLLIREKYAADE